MFFGFVVVILINVFVFFIFVIVIYYIRLKLLWVIVGDSRIDKIKLIVFIV